MMAFDPEGDERATPRKRVLLVDDHQLVREGLRLIIKGTDDLFVCADVGDASLGRQAVAELRPDVAVVDLSLGASGDDGLALVKWICAHHPQTRSVVSSMHDERLFGERALRAGASGYVNKSTSGTTVVEAIRRACKGELFFSQSLVEAMQSRSRRGHLVDTSPIEKLSDRELEVFRCIGRGLSSKEIARRLNVGISTVDTYRERLKAKLSIDSGTELVYCATRWTLENV
jgi:DNA-binding NarL/FixJ family response regulator